MFFIAAIVFPSPLIKYCFDKSYTITPPADGNFGKDYGNGIKFSKAVVVIVVYLSFFFLFLAENFTIIGTWSGMIGMILDNV